MATEQKFDLKKIRNLGIIAHIDAGKTTTTDHVLYYAGAKHKLGEVDKGTTHTDYDPEEQERGITIYSACIPFKWRDCTINLIDTPGHVDFTAEVERSLRVLDAAVLVFGAQKGVEAQSETVWRQADKYHVPRLVFINKMDVVGANFENAVAEVVERLEGTPVPLTIPIGSGSPKDSPTPFRGIIDLIEQKALFYNARDEGKTFRSEAIPAEYEADVRRHRDNLFEVLTRFDEHDRLTSAYLEGRDITADTLRTVLREQTIQRHIQPVLCGSGREHIGIQPLMDAVTWYLPSPLDRPPVIGRKPPPHPPHSGGRARRRGQGGKTQARSPGAVRRPGFQDRGGQARRPVLCPPLLRHAQGQQPGVEPRTPGQGIRQQAVPRPCRSDESRGIAAGVRRRHRRHHRPQGVDHRRHAVRSAAPHPAGANPLRRGGREPVH